MGVIIRFAFSLCLRNIYCHLIQSPAHFIVFNYQPIFWRICILCRYMLYSNIVLEDWGCILNVTCIVHFCILHIIPLPLLAGKIPFPPTHMYISSICCNALLHQTSCGVLHLQRETEHFAYEANTFCIWSKYILHMKQIEELQMVKWKNRAAWWRVYRLRTTDCCKIMQNVNFSTRLHCHIL